jgi:ABC-type sugar transport system ATPase subunit
LGKILAGLISPDGGSIYVSGRPVRFKGPREAAAQGIGIVHQEPSFCDNLSLAENLSLDRLPTRGFFLWRKEMLRLAQERMKAIGLELDPERPLAALTLSQRQLVQIAMAAAGGARILVFDEPTSCLSPKETKRLFGLIAELRARGMTAIYVSHRMEEIFQQCQTVTVLRDGRHVATRPLAGMDQDELVRLMIGRPLGQTAPLLPVPEGAPEILRLENFRAPGKFEGIGFSLRRGEILGLAGLVGAGRTELAQAIFGLDARATGLLSIHGQPVALGSPTRSLARGIGLVPEDRKRHGLVLMLGARANLSLPNLSRISRFGWLRQGIERDWAREYFQRFRLRASGYDAPAASLSGGNQQKVVLAKWLAAGCEVLILDEPTRGVDVGAKAEIHSLIARWAGEGKAILLISSELPELLALSHRILVLRRGRLAGEFPRAAANQENVFLAMAGVGP